MRLLNQKDVETGAEATLLFWLYFPFLAWAYVLDGSGSRPGWRYFLLSVVLFAGFCVLAHWWRLAWRFLWKRWDVSDRYESALDRAARANPWMPHWQRDRDAGVGNWSPERSPGDPKLCAESTTWWNHKPACSPSKPAPHS